MKRCKVFIIETNFYSAFWILAFAFIKVLQKMTINEECIYRHIESFDKSKYKREEAHVYGREESLCVKQKLFVPSARPVPTKKL